MVTIYVVNVQLATVYGYEATLLTVILLVLG
jgi:hypothetical protein